jgi:ABC-type amino acid transport substrate-binding protein
MIAKKKGTAVLKVQRMGVVRGATEERDAVKFEAENLRVQDNAAALLEDQVNVVKNNTTS